MFSFKNAILQVKSVGPRTLLWSTPAKTFFVVDMSSCILTENILFFLLQTKKKKNFR